MATTCGAKCAKGFLLTFNLVLWASGCGVFACGAFLLVDQERSTLLRLLSPLHLQLAWGLVGAGALVFLVGFLGCCGSARESRPLLVAYFIFLFIVMSCELAIGILSIIFQNKTLDRLEDLSSLLKEEYGVDGTTTEAFDYAQTKFKCCGIFGPEDYEDSVWRSRDLGKGASVAKTCCVLVNDDHMDPKPANTTWCQSHRPTEEGASFRHEVGCMEELADFVRDTTKMLAAIGCGVASLEIFGMIFAICLCKEV